MRSAALLTALLCFALSTAGAQADTIAGPRDSALVRARQLVLSGRDADGRRVIDSILRVSSPDTTIYGEALYWRAALAPTAADAERDYRRLLIETPLSLRAEDALLQLAQLEQSRGDRRAAADHLQRFMLSYPSSPARPRISLSLVKLLFDIPQQESRACDALKMARDVIPASRIEMRNQLDFYSPRCLDVASAPADSASKADLVTADTFKADEPKAEKEKADKKADTKTDKKPDSKADTKTSAKADKKPDTLKVEGAKPKAESAKQTTGFWSVQVAAYDSKEAAIRVAKSLASRGIDARVDGTVHPFRVRIGKYSTRAAAVKAAQQLKSQGQNGFVTQVK